MAFMQYLNFNGTALPLPDSCLLYTSDAIMEGLEEYASLATDDLKASVRKAGKTVKDEIAATAPKDTGKMCIRDSCYP